MSYHNDIEDAQKSTQAAKAKIDYIDARILTLDLEFKTLTNLENQLIENITILKNLPVVPVTASFLKSKEDLVKTKRQKVLVRNELEDLHRSRKNAITVFLKCQEAYDIIRSRSQSKVIVGNFGRKDGR